MQQVLTWYWSSRPCYVYDNTLTGVELHGDDQGPAAGVVHLLVGNCHVDDRVISKQPYLRFSSVR